MVENPYQQLAHRLDALPNGYPPTEEGLELRLLATLFSPEEAALTARLKITLETPAQIAARIGDDPETLGSRLQDMTRRGLIRAGRTEDGKGYGLLPFVVGIYEAQLGRISAELANLFEAYYQQAFGQMLSLEPPVHRVVPVGESVRMDMEVMPYESVNDIVDHAQAWGIIDCVCRKQKRLIGDPCQHPLDVCLVMSKKPGAYDGHPVIRALTHEGAQATLRRAADAGLVHTVSNNQKGTHYVCNCCTCSCGILRGMADLGIANVVARSAFINQVDEDMCIGCEECLDYCQFGALAMNDDNIVEVNGVRCVGCGICATFCLDEAMQLVRRPAAEIKPPPETILDWGMERAIVRDLDLSQIL